MGGIETNYLENNVGVRQGCTLSPTLFNIFIEELLHRLRNSGIGATLRGSKISTLGYADDIVLIADSEIGLQQLLNIVYDYGTEWHVKFSANKCKVMDFSYKLATEAIFDEVDNSNDIEFYLGNQILEKTNKIKYLGVTITDSIDIFGAHKRNQELCLLQFVGILRNASTRCSNSYRVLRDLWKGMAVPRAMFAAEVLNHTAGEVKKLEVLQNKVARMALGANGYIAVAALKGEMGWSLFQERIDKARLLFKAKLTNMEDSLAASVMNRSRRTVEFNTHSKWHRTLDNLEGRYGIDPEMVYRRRGWYNEINKNARDKSTQAWRADVEKKSTLQLYKQKKVPATEKYYLGDLKSSLLLKARTGSLEVRRRTYFLAADRNKNCLHCTQEEETISHLLLHCALFDDERRNYQNTISETIGAQAWVEEKQLADGGLSLLLGFKSSPHPMKIIRLTKNFLNDIWKKRNKIYL